MFELRYGHNVWTCIIAQWDELKMDFDITGSDEKWCAAVCALIISTNIACSFGI